MLNLNRRQFINPEMSKYIKEQTNKSIARLQEQYSKKDKLEWESAFPKQVSDLVKHSDIDIKENLPNYYFILPLVSLISFLAGYNFYNLIHN